MMLSIQWINCVLWHRVWRIGLNPRLQYSTSHHNHQKRIYLGHPPQPSPDSLLQMSLPRSTLPRRWPSLQAFTSHVIRRSIISHVKPPFPTIETCPSPTCQCAATPALPDGLPIDWEKSLNGTMAAYAEQVVVCTGKDDWSSRIEEENAGDNLVADVKELVGRGGKFADVCTFHTISQRYLDVVYLDGLCRF